MERQLTLKFETTLIDAFDSCRELIAARVHQQGRSQKSIAADMEYAPSHLSRKLTQGPEDSARFTLDDMEAYMRVTQDFEPIEYLVAKYIYNAPVEELEKRLAEIQSQIDERKRPQEREAGGHD